MLADKLRASTTKSLIYVGGRTQTFAGPGGGSTLNGPLTGLSGGIDTQPSAGDIVVLFCSYSNTGLSSGSIFPGDYSAQVSEFVSSTYNTKFEGGYKIMGATPDTTYTLQVSGLSNTDAIATYVTVWRSSTVAYNSAAGTNTTATAIADPPSITPTKYEAVVVVCGAAGGVAGAGSLFSSSELTSFLSARSNDTNPVLIGGGYKVVKSGSFDPAAFSINFTDSTSYSCASGCIAIVP
jgi:hypothetical protein